MRDAISLDLSATLRALMLGQMLQLCWRWTYPRRGGRPPVDARVAVLIEQMTRENPDGATSGSRANCSAWASG
jgi:hypothetical protein